MKSNILRIIAVLAVVTVAAINAMGQVGSWKQVCESGAWANALGMIAMDGEVWSIESSGSLYKTRVL